MSLSKKTDAVTPPLLHNHATRTKCSLCVLAKRETYIDLKALEMLILVTETQRWAHRLCAHSYSVLIPTTLTMHLPEGVIGLAHRSDDMQTKQSDLESTHAQVGGTG